MFLSCILWSCYNKLDTKLREFGGVVKLFLTKCSIYLGGRIIKDFIKLINCKKYSVDQIYSKLEIFLEKNDINVMDESRNTLLLRAIDSGENAIVKYLVEKGADVNGSRKARCYPLELACYYNDLEIIKILESSNKLDYKRKYDTSIAVASAVGSYEIVKYLLKKGVNPDQELREYPAVRWAAQENHLSILKLLADYGANVDIRDEEIQALVYTAVAVENLDMIRFLLSHKVPVEYEKHTTPFMLACYQKDYNIAKYLLINGADVNHRNLEGRTALFLAKVYKDTETETFLLQNGASVDVIDNNGIHFADLKDESIRKEIYDDLNPE